MTEHHDRKHAKYSGSNIHRLRRCPAQARMARAVDRAWGDSEHSQEGTAVHELLEAAFIARDRLHAHENYSEKRYASIRWVLDYVDGLRVEFPDLVVQSEQRVFFPQNVVRRDDCWGLADVVCYSPAAGRGWVIDYKNGVQPVDHPSENDQLWFYATAAFWEVSLLTITLVIIQPNGFTEVVREHTADAAELLTFQADINAMLLRCEADDAALVPGDWCSGCSVGAECGAREKAAIQAMTGKEGTLYSLAVDELPKAPDLNVERWADIMRQAGFIRAWLKSIEDAAYQYAVVQRNPFPGHKVVQANPKREWAADAEATAIGLAKITGAQPSAFLKTSCVGITEAEGVIKQLAKKVPNPEDITRAFSLLTVKRSSGTLSLVPDSDKRPAYDAAKEAFVGVVPSGFDEG